MGHWPLSMTGRVERLNHQMTDKIIHSMADAQWKGCIGQFPPACFRGHLPWIRIFKGETRVLGECIGYLRQGKSVPDPESVIRIRTPRPDDFQNLTGTSLSKYTSVLKFSRRSDQFFPGDMSQLVVENVLFRSQCRRIFFKNSRIRIRRRTTSKINPCSSSSSIDTSVIKLYIAWDRL